MLRPELPLRRARIGRLGRLRLRRLQLGRLRLWRRFGRRALRSRLNRLGGLGGGRGRGGPCASPARGARADRARASRRLPRRGAPGPSHSRRPSRRAGIAVARLLAWVAQLRAGFLELRARDLRSAHLPRPSIGFLRSALLARTPSRRILGGFAGAWHRRRPVGPNGRDRPLTGRHRCPAGKEPAVDGRRGGRLRLPFPNACRRRRRIDRAGDGRRHLVVLPLRTEIRFRDRRRAVVGFRDRRRASWSGRRGQRLEACRAPRDALQERGHAVAPSPRAALAYSRRRRRGTARIWSSVQW